MSTTQQRKLKRRLKRRRLINAVHTRNLREAAQAISEFTLVRMREDLAQEINLEIDREVLTDLRNNAGFYRRIMPPTPVTNDDLTSPLTS